MYIADPIERIETNIERMVDEAGPQGKCTCCGKVVGFDNLHQVYANPDSPAGCWDCCVKAWGYDPFEGKPTNIAFKFTVPEKPLVND